MTVDEIPEQLDAAVRRAAAGVPDQVWDLRAVTGRARRRWRHRLLGIVAGLSAAAVAGTGALVLAPADPPPVVDPASVAAIVAVDADHLYAVRSNCDGCPDRELVASDDGGRTWLHVDAPGTYELTAGPGGILVEREDGSADVSADGGRTWRRVTDDGLVWLAGSRPEAGLLTCMALTTCQIALVDPATGRRSPLNNPGRQTEPGVSGPPGLMQSAVRRHDAIWTYFHGGPDNSVIAYSGDLGRSWIIQYGECRSPACAAVPVPSLSGRSAYRVGDTGILSYTLTTNPGQGQSRALLETKEFTLPAGEGTAGVVTPDDNLLILRLAPGESPKAWLLGPRDTAVRPASVTGLPTAAGALLDAELTGDADTGYLLRPPTGTTVYRSADAVTWTAVTVHKGQ